MHRFLILLPLISAAQAAEPVSGAVSAWTYLQAALALCLIVGLLAAATWFARKASGGKGFGQGGMKVVGGVALGPRERLILIEVGKECLVVGIVPGQIRTLHRLPKDDIAVNPENAPEMRSFAQWLQGISERRQHD